MAKLPMLGSGSLGKNPGSARDEPVILELLALVQYCVPLGLFSTW